MSKGKSQHVGYVSRSSYDSIRSDLFWNSDTGKFYSDVWAVGRRVFTFSPKYIELVKSGKYIWLTLTEQTPANLHDNKLVFDPKVEIIDKL